MLKYSKITVWKCPFINLWQFSFTCPSYVFRILHSRKIRGSASRSQFKCELYLIRLYHMQWYNNCFSSYSWYLPSLHLSEVTIWIQPFMRLFCSQYHRMNLSKISQVKDYRSMPLPCVPNFYLNYIRTNEVYIFLGLGNFIN